MKRSAIILLVSYYDVKWGVFIVLGELERLI